MRIFDSKLIITDIIKSYQDGNSTQTIANMYEVTKTTIRDLLIEYDIPRRDRESSHRKHGVNLKYFEKIDTVAKAYFLGLLYADGNNFIKRGTISISLQEKDCYILELFRKEMKYKRELSKVLENKNTTEKMLLFRITSKELSKQLLELGLFNAKSLVLKFPTEAQVPKEFQSHFIRGYFDGDGCISVNKKGITWSMTSTIEFLENVQKILIKECILNKTKLFNRTPSKNTYLLSYSGFYSCKRIYEYLYKNCENFFLVRKKDKIKEFSPKRKERSYKLLSVYLENNKSIKINSL